MSRVAPNFRKSDVARAISAARMGGMKNPRAEVTIRPDRVVTIAVQEAAPPVKAIDNLDPLDQWLGERDAHSA